MVELKNEKIAVPVVLFAGLLWSFGPLVVRYMDNPNQVPWQYIFGRGLTIFIILNLYLYFEEGNKFWKNYLKIGNIIIESQKRNINTPGDLNIVVNSALRSAEKTILIVIYNNQNQKRYIGVKLD